MNPKNSFQIFMPFDRHVHFRQLNGLMTSVIPFTVRSNWGAVVMPNTNPIIGDWKTALIYKKQIGAIASDAGNTDFEAIMTCYLTDQTKADDLEHGFKIDAWKAAKLYPLGATTNSDSGVSDIKNIYHILERMQKIGMPLLIHPETEAARYEIPFTDRERVFIEETLVQIQKDFPELIISVEHITTKEACQFVESCSDNVVGTVTPQHIMYNHDALFHNGVHPYKPGMYVENMCLPILKWQSDVDYICKAIMTGSKHYKFGAGTDSAPHEETAKHDHCSRCGCYNSYASTELYAMVFDKYEMLNSHHTLMIFSDFMSNNNLWIYGLTQLQKIITIERKEQVIPDILPGNVRPFKAGQTIPFTVVR